MSDLDDSAERQRRKINRRYSYAIAIVGFIISPYVPLATIVLIAIAIFMECNNLG